MGVSDLLNSRIPVVVVVVNSGKQLHFIRMMHSHTDQNTWLYSCMQTKLSDITELPNR